MANKKSIDLSSSKLFGDNSVKETSVEDSPLYEEAKELREANKTEKRRGHPIKEDLVRGVPAQYGLTKDFIRATYILPVELANYVQDLAYTERIRVQDSVTMLLEIGKKEIEKKYKREGKEILHRVK